MTRAKDISKIVTDANLSGTLDVTGTVTAEDVAISSSVPILRFTDTDTNETATVQTSNAGHILLDASQGNASGSGGLYVRTQAQTLRALFGSNGDISFYEDTGTTPKFFWDSSEETLNLNTTSTLNNNFRLNIKGDGGNGGIVHSPNTDAATVPVLRMLNAAVSANVAELGTASGSDFYVSTGGTKRMDIDSGGDISFYEDTGTTPKLFWKSAEEQLSVQGAFRTLATGVGSTPSPHADAALVYHDNTTEANPTGIFFHNTFSSNSSSFMSFRTRNNAAAQERMRIDSSGNLIKVGGVIQGERGTASAPAYSFSDDIDTGMFNDANAHLGFSVGGSERMRIHSGGQLSLATTDATHGFNVGQSGTDFRGRFQGNNQYRLGLQNGTSNLVWLGSGGADNFRISNSSGQTRLEIDSNGLLKSTPTNSNITGSSANMVVFSDGQFARSTSSLRYKNTINDATHGLTELLTLRPVTYKGNNDGDTVFGGLIAEEVHDAGLTEFVTYNDDGQPDALAYGNMVSLCIKAIQELKTELDEAKARITALETA